MEYYEYALFYCTLTDNDMCRNDVGAHAPASKRIAIPMGEKMLKDAVRYVSFSFRTTANAGDIVEFKVVEQSESSFS